jgi:UDP-arabinose 4-epimerase
MKVLVTGGAGYVGSHTCQILKSAGYEPVVVDNMVYGHDWAVKWGPFYKADLHDTHQLIEIIESEKVLAVLHFAAFAYVGESVRDPLKYYINNVAGTASLLRAMLACELRDIVFSSTCATYGMPKEMPIVESTRQEPINPYGQSKLMVEKMLQDLAISHKLNSVSLRYFNAAGADPACEIGEDHEPETHLIPLAIEAAYRADRELTVFGTDYPTPDGTCVRDYIHVQDLAKAHVAALKRLSELSRESDRGEKREQGYALAYNLGTGQGWSVRQVIDGVEKVSGRQVKVKYGPRREGDPAVLVANAELAQKELGWRPQRSALTDILFDAHNWYKKHHLKSLP